MTSVNQTSTISSSQDSLALSVSTKTLGESARPVNASQVYANYDFIDFLGLAQRLRVPFLPITWQAPLSPIGRGGQGTINQALANAQTSFAFKLFKHPQYQPFREIAQEMAILSHPAVRTHEHIANLQGVCWDIPSADQVWPVLVFEKSHLGDLYRFSNTESFAELTIDDKLNLCADIGMALRDMHGNGILRRNLS